MPVGGRVLPAVVPARAGVAPGRSTGCSPGRRRPRPRGGRPTFSCCGRRRGRSSPPARGSPGHRRGWCCTCSVVPARAGVAPVPPRWGRRGRSRPRPRGGRPDMADHPPVPGGSSPPARGSPPVRHLIHRERPVVPARAGVAPPAPASRPRSPHRPRPRGGRPNTGRPERVLTGSSPPARGSPGLVALAYVVLEVVPARAGVAHVPRASGHSTESRPRPRGGRPSRARTWVPWIRSSPPARGSHWLTASPAQGHIVGIALLRLERSRSCRSPPPAGRRGRSGGRTAGGSSFSLAVHG